VSGARVAIWVSSLGAIALALRSVVVGPIPVWLAFLAFAMYLGLALVGVLVPQLEMFADVLSRGSGERRVVALTFDDGPSATTTPQVLEQLARASVKATFFVVGEKVDRHPDVVRAIAEAGHELGVHGYRHHRLYAFLTPKAVAEDIRHAQDAVERASGVRPRWFRPPVGFVSPRTAAGARRAGASIVAWTIRSLDGLANADPRSVAARVERRLTPGAIVVLHDAAEREDHEPASLRALPAILENIARRGFLGVSVSELSEGEQSG